MPQDEQTDKTPNLNMPNELHFERGSVVCQRCRREFDNFMIEIIENITQLRCGSGLITKIEMVCMHCGAVFYWNIREKDVSKMALEYGKLVLSLGTDTK